MANTYQYSIKNLQRDANGIVVAVEFEVAASDGTDSFTHNYQTALPAPTSTIVPFEDLTEAKVIDWVKELVGEQTEEQADAELAAFKLRKQQTVTSGTPW